MYWNVRRLAVVRTIGQILALILQGIMIFLFLFRK
jgi:hypothetical protein